MVYQVGNPAILEGKRFFPLTGIPIPNMLLSSTRLADWDPDPLTVATWMLKSLTIFLDAGVCSADELPVPGTPTATSPVAIWPDSLPQMICAAPDFVVWKSTISAPDIISQW